MGQLFLFMKLNSKELKAFLEHKFDEFNTPSYIETDPIQVPHLFSQPADIEIAAFLTASIAWGNRQSIIKNARRLVQYMDFAPSEFVLNFQEADLERFAEFKHRTFNGTDAVFFLRSLQNIYRHHGGLGAFFESSFRESGSIKEVLSAFYRLFFSIPSPERTRKHVANVAKKSAAKRLNMLLRWLVRHDGRGVDFGLWQAIPPSALYIPLDVHSGNVGRKLGLLTRKQNDWQAVEELTEKLRQFDPTDPVKYDYSLFGLGVFEKF